MSKSLKVLQLINNLNAGGAQRLMIDSLDVLQSHSSIETDLMLLDGRPSSFSSMLEDFLFRGRLFKLSKSWVYNPLLIFKIIPYLKKYDIVHVHLFPALYFVAIAKFLIGSKVRLIFTEHSPINKRRIVALAWLERWIYNRYDTIICVSPQVRKSLQTHLGFTEDRFRLINNGINLSRFKLIKGVPNTDLAKPDDFVLVKISRFTFQKDQMTLIKAIPYLDFKVQVLLVGTGPNLVKYRQYAEEHNLSDRVEFLGVRTDIPEILNRADLVILSSKYEGQSISGLEAMASETPIVASDIEGLTKMAEGCGLLFSTGDEADLAKQITR